MSLDPGHIDARINLTDTLVIGNLMDAGIAHYREVLRLQPGHPLACANLLKPFLDVCDWDGAEALVAGLVDRWRAQDATVLDALTPFASLLVDVPQAMRLAAARRCTQRVMERAAGLAAPRAAPELLNTPARPARARAPG